MKKNLLITSISMLLVFVAHASKRIQAVRFDRSETKEIYLSPGLGTVLLFPCSIIEAFVGRGDDLKAQISPNDRKTLFLNLKKNSSLPTNLIVRCEEQKTLFVFDVVPSMSRHQDILEIRNFFGRPEYQEVKETRVEFKEPVKAIVLKKPEIVGSGR